ncbi:MAG: YggS family pyridoxal phosphate-dependent enzyme [Gemmatimonadales bacterium]
MGLAAMTPVESRAAVAANVAAVRGRIARACERVGRDASEVTLVAVSKTFGPECMVAAAEAGVREFGENRVQEALPKFEAVRTALGGSFDRLTTHLVGHLQTNKVGPAIGGFDILHAVDSERLLRAINAAATAAVRVMIEVNVSGESTKYGIAPGELRPLLAVARELPCIRVEGLMTVAPRMDDPGDVRPVFRTLARLGREHGLPLLSMGMTEDFEVAIEEGSTHVRVGRAIFGERG